MRTFSPDDRMRAQIKLEDISMLLDLLELLVLKLYLHKHQN